MPRGQNPSKDELPKATRQEPVTAAPVDCGGPQSHDSQLYGADAAVLQELRRIELRAR